MTTLQHCVRGLVFAAEAIVAIPLALVISAPWWQDFAEWVAAVYGQARGMWSDVCTLALMFCVALWGFEHVKTIDGSDPRAGS